MKSSRHLTQVRNLLGSQELAPVRTPPSVTQLLLRGAKLGFATWKMAIVLTALLAAAPLSSPFLQAALMPTFSAGGNQYPNVGSINVPITVVSDFTSLQGVQFSLQWTPGVLQY